MTNHVVQDLPACFQMVMALLTVTGYIWHFLPQFRLWLRGGSSGEEVQDQQGQKPQEKPAQNMQQQDSDLKLCFNFSVQVDYPFES